MKLHQFIKNYPNNPNDPLIPQKIASFNNLNKLIYNNHFFDALFLI